MVLAAMMIVATMSMALAADPAYSITINNSSSTTVSIVGKTYTAYKLFDVTYTGSNASDPHAYSIDSDGDGAWAWNTIKGSLKSGSTTVYENTAYGLTFTPTAADPTVYSVTSTMNADQARALADALQPVVTGSTAPSPAGSVNATAETAQISLNEPGYFVVYGTVKANDPADGSKELVAAVALTTADPAETVIPKVSAPPLDKKITGEHKLDEAGKAATAQIGATVSFELDSKVPDLTGYTDYTFTITDTMTDGLDYTGTDTANAINGLVLKINGTEKTLGTDYTIAHTVGTRTFTLTIPQTTLAAAHKDDAIVVTYSAVVNDTALTTDYEKNTANLTYSNNPYDDTTNKTEDHEVYVIDVDINVDKVANSADGAKLKDAEFKVFKGSTQPADTDLSWYKWDSANKVVTWVAKANADTFTTGDDGKFTPAVQGLEAEATGTSYGLLETAAPAGYNPLPAPVIVTLKSTYAENSTGKTATVTATGATVTNGTVTLSADQNSNQPLATAQVINNSGTELPSTGGIGTTIFYIAGLVLVLGAAAIVIARRKAEQ
jgi:fimbrial isopeptide formation D2 family protein/LPXTG-motif cell wall-anchored protein